MALDFPDSAVAGDLFTRSHNKTFAWDGRKWRSHDPPALTGADLDAIRLQVAARRGVAL